TARVGGALPRAAPRYSRTAPAGRAGMGALQLAKLLCAPAGLGGPAQGHAKAARPGRGDASRNHVRAPRSALHGRAAPSRFAALRTSSRSRDPASDLCADGRGGPGPGREPVARGTGLTRRRRAGCSWSHAATAQSGNQGARAGTEKTTATFASIAACDSIWRSPGDGRALHEARVKHRRLTTLG